MLNNRSMPRSAVIPEIPYPNLAQAIAWLSGAFGFTLRLRIADHRAQMNVGEGAVVLTRQETAEPPAPLRILIRVADADAHCARSRTHGAYILREPATFPYGERQYTARDLAGHQWTFSQSVADIHPGDWGGEAGDF